MFDVFYLNYPSELFPHERSADSIEHACEMSRTRYLWIVDGRNDYSAHDWSWEPSPWQSNQAHVWPSQHQANGGTWLVPKNGYQAINRDHAVIPRVRSVPRLHVKHMSSSADQGQMNTRYISDYLGTLRRALQHVDWSYCWVTSDVCDYGEFDWTWHPSEWQTDMLHVFASKTYTDCQQFGDTFFVPVARFLEQTKDLALLEWFDTLHFVPDRAVPRHPVPKIRYHTDSLVDTVWQHDFQAPVAEFYRHWPSVPRNTPALNLWRQDTKAVTVLNAGATTVFVPREVKNFLQDQIYDYPVIRRVHTQEPEPALDVVFISNGEHAADHHYDVLRTNLRASMNGNQLLHIQNVDGRVACYRAAAQASTTDWFFAVFAKLQVNEDFDWQWQPDRLQQPKHYIFHAYNPVNHLVYGHQAIIAYNRRLVLENPATGLDFTLDQPHEVVPVISGTAYYDCDPWTCWRTAFRECIKLRHAQPDVENQYRLDQWLAVGDGTNGAWSVLGARDAVAYYNTVDGRFDDLKKSYEWRWLASYALMLHPELFTAAKT